MRKLLLGASEEEETTLDFRLGKYIMNYRMKRLYETLSSLSVPSSVCSVLVLEPSISFRGVWGENA